MLNNRAGSAWDTGQPQTARETERQGEIEGKRMCKRESRSESERAKDEVRRGMEVEKRERERDRQTTRRKAKETELLREGVRNRSGWEIAHDQSGFLKFQKQIHCLLVSQAHRYGDITLIVTTAEKQFLANTQSHMHQV